MLTKSSLQNMSYCFFSIRYKAEPAGTHFCHSHSGLQRSDGLYGALVVREPDDPSGALYDHDLSDHVILIQDWMLMLAQTMFTGHHHGDGFVWDRVSRSMIINGKDKSYDSIEFFFKPNLLVM